MIKLLIVLLFFLSTLSLAAPFNYGNFCGEGSSDVHAAPIDALDAICKAHDQCCSCSDQYQLTWDLSNIHFGGTIMPSICSMECNTILVHKLQIYIVNNCKVAELFRGEGLAKAKQRAHACAVARAGFAYNKMMPNMTQIKSCYINNILYHKNSCTEAYKNCIKKISWPKNSELNFE